MQLQEGIGASLTDSNNRDWKLTVWQDNQTATYLYTADFGHLLALFSV